MLNSLFDMPECEASLHAAFSDETILHACGQQLAEEDSGWVCCRPINALYQPGRSMMLAIALLKDASIPEDRLWPESDIVYLHDPVRVPVSRRGKVITLGGRAAEAYRFPNDRRLRSLRKITGTDDACELWSTLFSLKANATPDLKRQLLRYAPEQKFVARLRDRASDDESHRDGVALRVCDPRRAMAMAQRHKDARKLLKNRPRSLDVPRLIGGDLRAGVVAVQWIKGDGLLQTLAAGDEEAVLELLAQSLHDFHQMAMPGLAAVTPASLAPMIDAAAADLAGANPALAPALAALQASVMARLRGLRVESTGTIHNDFYFDQVRVRRHRCTIVDLERVAVGDPLIDVANFIFQMRILPHRPHLGVAAPDAERWAQLFLEQWQRTTGASIDAERMAAYCAISALVLARGMMRHLRPGWKTLVHHCVAEAESMLCIGSSKS